MRFRALLALLWLTALAVTTARADPPQAEARPGYIADHECAACHPRQAAAFEGSKHRHAMATASPASVRADFADTRFDGPRQATRFTRQLARFMVRTEGADGRPADFEVSHTFGIHPLQQYLIPQAGGRLQALGVAWDTTRRRWFSLLADDPPPPDSPRTAVTHGHAWTADLDEELRDGVELGLSVEELAESMELPGEVVRARLTGLGLEAGRGPTLTFD